jgi:hypothetical protein
MQDLKQYRDLEGSELTKNFDKKDIIYCAMLGRDVIETFLTNEEAELATESLFRGWGQSALYGWVKPLVRKPE